jgi:hypothetical protein
VKENVIGISDRPAGLGVRPAGHLAVSHLPLRSGVFYCLPRPSRAKVRSVCVINRIVIGFSSSQILF